MRSSANKIQLTGFDDLFQAGGEVETSGERVRAMVPLAVNVRPRPSVTLAVTV